MVPFSDFPLDSRYPKQHPHEIYFPPKLDYMWYTKKLAGLDPKPGEAGYFAVLVRVLKEPHILNRTELTQYVLEGQLLFRELGITNTQMANAHQEVKAHLLSAQQCIDQEWESAMYKLSLPLEIEWECELAKWRDCCAEIIAYGEAADPAWAKKSQNLLLSLQDALASKGRRPDFTRLATAIGRRVKSVQASYLNAFTCLYTILGERAAKFIEYEKSLFNIIPIVALAPPSAPTGLGRNARFGTAPCADVVVRFTRDDVLYVGVITPRGDSSNYKLLGGKCGPSYNVMNDGSINVMVDTTEVTALREFMEEAGAEAVGEFHNIDKAHRELLDHFVPPWKDELSTVGCIIKGYGIIWSQRAKAIVEEVIKTLLKPCIIDIAVPDKRTTRNAGYATTLYEVVLDIDQPLLFALFLALAGGDDAASFGFYPAASVALESTHEEIYAQYLEYVHAEMVNGTKPA